MSTSRVMGQNVVQPRGGKAEIDGGPGSEKFGPCQFQGLVPILSLSWGYLRGARSLVLFIFQDKDRLDLG